MAAREQFPFNIVIVGQGGRLQYEAVIFAASLRTQSPRFGGKLFVAEPQKGSRWPKDPTIRGDETRQLLNDLGAEIIPFESKHFGQDYPQGNKIEALFALPKGEPFVFFDTDTLVLDDLGQVPFDFSRPSASLKRENTWPEIQLYGPGYTATWKSLYDKFDLDFESSLDPEYPDEFWRRYLYFNAGFFYYKCPHQFGQKFLDYALTIRNDPPKELVCQSFDPWLDQVALPLVIHALGGGRDALPSGYLDGDTTCHYRMLPLLYARETDRVINVLEEVTSPNRIKKILKNYDAMKFMIYHGRGRKVRDLFDRNNLPRKEQAIRNTIKRNGFWMR
ncbi:glycosyltransferase family 2 protein [Roseovarius sp. EL26]|uniref:glycosyltransferase family 2 protein n=1 Tax=Roseovarius sp. EL26 TaxID=2126672 RepID=UPI000EA0764D|nr:glycosyltransferase family 2 protein [Roseovarius sp. EL26]